MSMIIGNRQRILVIDDTLKGLDERMRDIANYISKDLRLVNDCQKGYGVISTFNLEIYFRTAYEVQNNKTKGLKLNYIYNYSMHSKLEFVEIETQYRGVIEPDCDIKELIKSIEKR